MLEYGCLLVARLGINEAHLWQANRKSVHAATRRRLIRELKHSLAGLAMDPVERGDALDRLAFNQGGEGTHAGLEGLACRGDKIDQRWGIRARQGEEPCDSVGGEGAHSGELRDTSGLRPRRTARSNSKRAKQRSAQVKAGKAQEK